jgi:hypothetical protein
MKREQGLAYRLAIALLAVAALEGCVNKAQTNCLSATGPSWPHAPANYKIGSYEPYSSLEN